MEKMQSWLLVANASKGKLYSFYKAKLFTDSHPSNLHLIDCYLHDASRLKERDLVTDIGGLYSHNRFAETTPHKVHEAEVFALELIQHLEAGRNANSYQELVLVAPPHFIGVLENHMHPELKKLVSKKIEKDFTLQNEEELVKNLLHYL